MAIYHLSIKIISRGKGKPAVAAAAYRAGEKIISDYTGNTHDYTRKGGVIHTEIILPEHAPPEYTDRSVLWNAVEEIEKAKKAQLAREVEIALPKELSAEKNIVLVREYVKHTFVDQGMCADVAVHDKSDDNPHAHIMLTMRPFNEDGTWGDKQKKEYILDGSGEKIYDKKKRQYKCKSVPTTDWNEQTKAEDWRSAWADCVNKFLESENVAERVDHRSYERQGIEQIPTVHMGVAAFQMERKGIRTERGDTNRAINLTNQIRQLRTRINKLEKWLNEEAINTAPPTLYDVISSILSRRRQTSETSQKVYNLKAASQVLNFLTDNNITDMVGLQDKVGEMYKRQNGLREKLKSIERRLKVLDDHIEQAGYYQEFKDIYIKYTQQKPKNQENFREAHRREITLYEAAEKYLKQHLNGHSFTRQTLKTWKSELAELTAKKDNLYKEYDSLKEETREVEQIKRSVESIMRESGRESNHTRKNGIEL